MRSVQRVAAAVFLFAGAVVAVRFAVGYGHFDSYLDARERVQSVESGFPGLERELRSAVRCYPAPDFLGEMGGLYLDMAQGANSYGTAAKRLERDAWLGRAEAALLRLLRGTPVRASAWYDLGRVYFLYNFPVLSYRVKGRACIRRAIELAPADGYINENGLFIFLAQWAELGESERAFARARIAEAARENPELLKSVRALWKRSFPSAPLPDEIFPPGS